MTLELLDDYLSGHLADGDVALVEEALFAGHLDDELGFIDGVACALRHLVARGTYDPCWTRAEATARRAVILDLGRPPPDGLIDAAELVVLRLAPDLRGLDRLEIVVEQDGVPLKTTNDAHADPEDGAIYLACEAKHLLPGAMVRVSGVRGRTGRELVASFSLERRAK